MTPRKKFKTIEHKNVLPLPFLYLKLCGIWRPLTLNLWLEVTYNLFTVAMIIITEIVIITEILCIVFADENKSKLFKDNIYIIFTILSGWFKMLNFVNRRHNIISLTSGCIAEQWNLPKDQNESSIITEYNQLARNITVTCAVMTSGSVLSRLLNPIFTTAWTLPVDAWYPCNMNLSACYWTSYAHQATGYTAVAVVHLSNECLVATFMMQICAQLDVLSHRLISVPVKVEKAVRLRKDRSGVALLESCLINECISNHNDILKFSQLLSETFLEVVFIQFCVGLSVICTSIYLLAKVSIFSFDFLGMLLYLVCMLIQILLYCWFGNEVILNSLKLFDSIYHMDWFKLQNKTQRALLVMMCASSSPIQLFKGAIVKVNLNTFIDILKLSYSAFNLLQKTS